MSTASKNVIYYLLPKVDEMGCGVVDLRRAGLFDAETRLARAGLHGSATSCRAWERHRRHALLGRLTFSWGSLCGREGESQQVEEWDG